MPHYFKPSKRRRHRPQLVSDTLRGVTVEFYTSGGVFSPKGIDEGTRILLEYMEVWDGAKILDIGCGYGVIGITLAKAHPNTVVYMVDINPQAVKLAKLNARINGVEKRVRIFQGNLYGPVKGELFDIIVSNPPLSAGWTVVEEIIRGAPAHLAERGLLQMVFKKGGEKAVKTFREAGLGIRKTISKKGYKIIIAEKAAPTMP